MIRPTIGRVVLYFPCAPFPANDGSNPVPALVCRVWSDRCINIGGFDVNGSPFNVNTVILHQEGDPKPPGAHCAWMPYQVEAAKRALSNEAREELRNEKS